MSRVFHLEINCDGETFGDNRYDALKEVVRLLFDVAAGLHTGSMANGGAVRTADDERVGSYALLERGEEWEKIKALVGT